MKAIILALTLLLSLGSAEAKTAAAKNTTAANVEANVPSNEELAELQVEAPSTDFVAKENASEAATPIVDVATTSEATEGAAPKAEVDIPVTLDPKIAAKGSDGSLRDMMLAAALLGGFGLLIWLGLTKYRTRNAKVSQFQMKILAQHHLGPKKSLMVVRVAGESVLLGVTDHNINLLKSLSLLDDDIPVESPTSFGGVFSETAFRRQPAEETDDGHDRAEDGQTASASVPEKNQSRFSFRKKPEDTTDSEDFTISKIRDVVHRQVRNLKNLE